MKEVKKRNVLRAFSKENKMGLNERFVDLNSDRYPLKCKPVPLNGSCSAAAASLFNFVGFILFINLN